MSDIKSRSDVVNEVAAQIGKPQKEVDEVLRAFESAVMRQASTGGEIRLTGFGSFKISNRAARTSRNPQTGEPIEVAERNAIRFVPGQLLKDAAASSLKGAAPAAKAKARPAAKKAAKAESAAPVEEKAEKKEKKSKKKSKS